MSDLKTPYTSMKATDEFELSMEYPDTIFISVIKNGIPMILPFKDAVESAMQELKEASPCEK